MCGIIGYVGSNNGIDVVIEGLKGLNIEVMILQEYVI